MQWLDRTDIAEQSDEHRGLCVLWLQWLDRTYIAEQCEEHRGYCFHILQRIRKDNSREWKQLLRLPR